MITIKGLISAEGSADYLKELLLDEIETLKKNNIEEKTFSFNVYDVTINTSLNKVVISENLTYDENDSMTISLDHFQNELKNLEWVKIKAKAEGKFSQNIPVISL